MNEPIRLYAAAQDDVTLPWTLGHAPDGIALLTDPRRYRVGLVSSGQVSLSDGLADIEEVFEAHVFNPASELRWLNLSDGRGTAVFLSEDATILPTAFTERLDDIEAIDSQPGAYLLWGRCVAADNGWSTLTTERIGTLEIPASITRGDYATVTTREYIAVDSEHGNAYVAEERLLAFRTVPSPLPEVSAP